MRFAGIFAAVLTQLPAFGLEVRVVDRESGKPLGGAMVISRSVTNITDGAGRTTTEGPDVMVRKSGYAPMKNVASGPVEFMLLRAETSRGRVIDTRSNGVPGAAITVIVPGPLTGARFAVEDFPVTSDAEGRWTCDFIPKDSAYVRLEFSHPDFEWPEQNVSLPTAELKVHRVGTISGRVLNDAGQPVAGAMVVLGDERSVRDEPATGTDSEGKFAFPRQHPQHRLIGIDADGWAPTLTTVGTNFAPIEVRLGKGKPWRIRVQDDSAQPLAGVKASIAELEDANRGQWYYWDREWSTDANGTLVWTNAPEQPCAWNFSKSGYMGQSHLRIEPSQAETIVKLGPAFGLTGEVIDAATKKPIPEFVFNGRYVLPERSSTPGKWYDYQRKTFRDGKFSVYYEQPLFGGATQMHDWQFRVEADGYEPVVSRVVRDAERGTNIFFELKPQPVPPITVAAPAGKKRVTAALALQSATVGAGETVTVFIKLRVAEGHWIYALEKSGSENLPTRIEADLPRAIEQDGSWRGPEPKIKADGSRTIAGEALLSCRYLAGGFSDPRKHKLRFKLEFQVCNELLCWPPESIDMEAELEIVKPR